MDDSAQPIENLEKPPEAVEPQLLPRRRWGRLLELVGSFYGIALLVAAASLWLFGWLADEVLEQDLAALNRDLLLWIHTNASPRLEWLAHTLSWIGSFYGSTLIVLLFVGWLLRHRRFIDAFAFVCAVCGGSLLSLILKQVFRQIRPTVFPPLAVETSFSFPSGHSLTSFCLWGFIACWIVLQQPRDIRRWIAAAMAVGLAAMIAVSRMYLGVHWPTDVTAGALVATFWVTVCVSGQRWLIAHRARRKLRRAPAYIYYDAGSEGKKQL